MSLVVHPLAALTEAITVFVGEIVDEALRESSTPEMIVD